MRTSVSIDKAKKDRVIQCAHMENIPVDAFIQNKMDAVAGQWRSKQQQ